MNHRGKGWYVEMCQRPEWQQKRLKILERDDWQCQVCGTKTETLAVHHWYYKSGSMPWEYPDRALTTMCEACHKEHQAKYRNLSGILLDGLFHLLGHTGVQELVYAVENRSYDDDDDFIPALPAPFSRRAVERWAHDAACWLSPRCAEDDAEIDEAIRWSNAQAEAAKFLVRP